MSHYGIFCPPAKGHLNTMLSLARRLRQRRHRITFFQVPDLESYVLAAGADAGFSVLGKSEYPIGSLKQLDQRQGQLSGTAAMRFAVERFLPYAEVFLREGTQAIREAKVDVVLVDQLEVYGGTIADRLSIPFISVASALPMNAEAGIPPIVTDWAYSRTASAKQRNIEGYKFLAEATASARELVNQYRVRWGLQPLPMEWWRREEAYSNLAQISQLPTCLDFPREKPPATLHAVGLLMDDTIRGKVSFPWERLDDRPLIYACLGTLQNGQAHIFRAIAEACAGLDAQLVVSLGGDALTESELGPLPGNPVIVRYAPQDELLKRSRLLVTHGSLNTTLEALSYGVPMVAIPIANDQPGVASRMAWHEVGKVMPLKQLTVSRLRHKLSTVWHDTRYRENAKQMKSQLCSRDALGLACDIIERSTIRREYIA